MNLAKTGAIFFVLWGLVHVVGGAAILQAVGESPAQGFAIYAESTATYTPLAGAILAYLAYSFLWLGVVVTIVGIRYNWRNSHAGLQLNTALVGLTDLGLVVFLVLPGYLSWTQASPGLVLFIAAALAGGLACKQNATSPAAIQQGR